MSVFDIVAGGHKARVTLTMDGKGGFVGAIASDEFGDGKLAGVVTGSHLAGSAMLDGHSARFDATLSDGGIAGRLTAGWFFAEDFSGKEIAA